MTTVAVLGTGIMGAAMARTLATHDVDVRVWNRSRDKAEPLADVATVCDTVREAATSADVVLTMLADADAVAATMSGDDGALAAGWGDDVLWLRASTVGIEGFGRLAELAEQAGVTIIDASALGTKGPAEKGELVVLAAGGSAAALERFTPVFDAISGGALDLPYAHLKGGLMIDGELPVSFPLSGAARDSSLIVAAGDVAGVDLQVAAAVGRQLAAARDAGHGDEDMSAVWYAARRRTED